MAVFGLRGASTGPWTVNKLLMMKSRPRGKGPGIITRADAAKKTRRRRSASADSIRVFSFLPTRRAGWLEGAWKGGPVAQSAG